MAKLKTITKKKTRLESLKALALLLAEQLDNKPDIKNLAPLSKQYRETIAEIDLLEGMNDTDDEIGEILSERKADGKSGSIR